MSEIKFACPACAQHIACDASYADLAIDCPACGQSMVVPRLTGLDSAHGGMVVVASTSAPAPPVPARIPVVRAWTEEEWAAMAGPTNASADGALGWLAVALGTLILVMLLRAHGLGVGPIMILAVLGSVVAGVVLARNRTGSGARAILTALALVVAVMIALPVLALSILFVGCAACHY